MKLLDQEDLSRAVEDLPGWTVEGRSLTRTCHFADFLEAMAFVNEAARIAEEMGHHPDLDIRYNVVKVALTTHDGGGVTDLDVAAAQQLSRLLR